MAGVGFELKRLFRKKGAAAFLRAYGYAGMITAGPMLLGMALLLGEMLLADWMGLPGLERELLTSMITYALLASLMVSSPFSMVTTRHAADMLYEERGEAVLPAFEGSCAILLGAGGLLYFLFLAFAGITFTQVVLNYLLFGELLVVWMEMNYLTAIKNYRGIVNSFFLAIAGAFLSGFLLARLFEPSVEGFLVSVCVGYGLMLCANMVLMYQFFPKGEGSRFAFLRWFDEYRPLAAVGFFTNAGLFSHLVIGWMGPLGVQVKGLFYGAPQYDVPALFAFLSVLVTTINFVVSVEVNFYPRYRNYYDLFNQRGSVRDIEQAEGEMLTVLERELAYTGRKQLYATALMLSAGLALIARLPLGFTDLMEGYFRTLCVGYGLYAVANMLMLILLYFTDYRGACIASVLFGVTAAVGSLLSFFLDVRYYGFAFMGAGMVYFLVAWRRLRWFCGKLPYHILSVQPMVWEPRRGGFTRLAEWFEEKEGGGRWIEE